MASRLSAVIPADIAPRARAAWSDLRDQLVSALGDDLVAMWAHGGMTVADSSAHAGDLDTHVILGRRPTEQTARRVEEIHQATSVVHAVEWDTWYLLVDDARRSDPPSHAWHEGKRDTSWAIHRAHWLAGRYVNLHGPEPEEIVRSPTWDEILGELDRELEHVERHVAEGDTDPYEAAYAILNGSRILRSLETRDVVISKPGAGAWALEHLPARWHDAVRAALRCHAGHGTAGDADLLAAQMAPFTSFVRKHLPPTTDRRPDALPRWSGY